jgi:hypothetical protein
MNTRFTLSAVLTLLGGVGLTFFSFLGNMYLTQGNYLKSALYPAILTLLLVVIAFAAANFKKARFNFRKNAIKEILFLIIYFIVAFFSLVSFTHYFNIQDKKQEIGTKIKSDIDQVRNMFVEYEDRVNKRVQDFDGFLETLIAGKNTNRTEYLKYFVQPGPDDQTQKNNKLVMFKDDLRPDKYDTIKAIALEWLQNSEQIVMDVKPFGLMEVISDFETNANEWYSQIQTYDQTVNTFPDEQITVNFEYQLSFASVTDELTKVEKPNVLALLFFFLAHLLILLVYIMAIRDGKSDGFIKSLLSKDNNSRGDL